LAIIAIISGEKIIRRDIYSNPHVSKSVRAIKICASFQKIRSSKLFGMPNSRNKIWNHIFYSDKYSDFPGACPQQSLLRPSASPFPLKIELILGTFEVTSAVHDGFPTGATPI